MKVVKYSSSMCDQWDEFVCNHDYAWVGHHSSMFELEKEFGNENISLMLLDDKEKVIGIMPLFFYIKKIKNIIPLQKSLISASSLRSGPLLAQALSKKQQEKALDLLISETIALGKSLKVDNINIEYPVMYRDQTYLEHAKYFPLRKYGFEEDNVVGMVKDLSADEETLFSSLNNNCRTSIRKCISESGEFVNITDRTQWIDCYDINVQTFNSKFSRPYSLKTLEILWDNFVVNGLAEVTAVKHNGKIISITISAVMNNSCYPWIGFNSKPAPIKGTDNLLTWKTMLFFKQKDIRFFEIGSREFSHSKQINISKFKESFNGFDTYCLGGNLIFNPFKLFMLKMLKQLILRLNT